MHYGDIKDEEDKFNRLNELFELIDDESPVLKSELNKIQSELDVLQRLKKPAKSKETYTQSTGAAAESQEPQAVLLEIFCLSLNHHETHGELFVSLMKKEN